MIKPSWMAWRQMFRRPRLKPWLDLICLIILLRFFHRITVFETLWCETSVKCAAHTQWAGLIHSEQTYEYLPHLHSMYEPCPNESLPTQSLNQLKYATKLYFNFFVGPLLSVFAMCIWPEFRRPRLKPWSDALTNWATGALALEQRMEVQSILRLDLLHRKYLGLAQAPSW